MDKPSEAAKPNWFSIREAADYLEVGEPTIYRWMRDQKITFRKVGDSTRFLKEDLDAVVEVHRSAKDAQNVHRTCPVCHEGELIEGSVQSTGLNHFRPKKTKFWTIRDANVETRAWMCPHCGAILWFGDQAKLAALRAKEKPSPADAAPVADAAPAQGPAQEQPA